MTAAPPSRSIMERIWEKTEPIPECGCYIWMGRVYRGYGEIDIARKTRRVHNVAYEQLVGPIPDGLMLDHKCRVRSCWRPEHMEPVTNKENVLRGEGPTAVNARKTYCSRGHPYTEENTHISSAGDRRCRACWQRKYRRKGAK